MLALKEPVGRRTSGHWLAGGGEYKNDSAQPALRLTLRVDCDPARREHCECYVQGRASNPNHTLRQLGPNRHARSG